MWLRNHRIWAYWEIALRNLIWDSLVYFLIPKNNLYWLYFFKVNREFKNFKILWTNTYLVAWCLPNIELHADGSLGHERQTCPHGAEEEADIRGGPGTEVCMSQQGWHSVMNIWVVEGNSLRLSLVGAGGCFSEELGLRLRVEAWVWEFAVAREGEPKVQGRGEKGQLVYVAFWEFLSGSKWPELKNVGEGCGKMWLREKGRDTGFSQPCSGVFTKSWGEWESFKGFSLEGWHDS